MNYLRAGPRRGDQSGFLGLLLLLLGGVPIGGEGGSWTLDNEHINSTGFLILRPSIPGM